MTDPAKGSFDFKKLTDAVAEAVRKAKDVTTTAANDHRDKVHDIVDKAAAKVDERTQGKYSDKVAKAKGAAHTGLDKVADQAPSLQEGAQPGDATASPFPTDHEAPGNDPRTNHPHGSGPDAGPEAGDDRANPGSPWPTDPDAPRTNP